MQEPKAQCSCGSSENIKSEVNEKKMIENRSNSNLLKNYDCISCTALPITATKTEELICSCKLKESATDINLQNNQWKAEGENIGYKYNTKKVVEKSTEIQVISEVSENKQAVLEDIKKPENIEYSKIFETKNEEYSIEINEITSEKESANSEEFAKQEQEIITVEEVDCCTVEGCDNVISEGVTPKICPHNQKCKVVIKIRLTDFLKDNRYIINIPSQRELIETEMSKRKLLENAEQSNVDVKLQEPVSVKVDKDEAINITGKKSKKGKYYYTKEEATFLDSIKKLFKSKIKKKNTLCFHSAKKIPTSDCRIKVEAWEKHDANTCSGDEKYTYIGELLFPVCSKEIFYKPPGIPIRKSMKSYTLNDPNNFGKTELVHRLYAYRDKIIPYNIVNDDFLTNDNKIENCAAVLENISEL